jgi:NAD(P)-dependent dehydrogenase (short-subunit alcohol dehydrogenase family)
LEYSAVKLSSTNLSAMVQGKVFTVLGAASGIGQATAIRLAELGALGIAISDVNLDGLKETKDLCISKFLLYIMQLN